MLRRLKRALLSITATATFIIALLIVVSVVGQRYQFSTYPRSDVLILYSDSGETIRCHRDNSGLTILTDDKDEIIWLQPVSSEAELERCIEAYKSGRIPFDPRNYIGRYEAGYVSWEGVDHEDIHHWGVPDECAPHYEFKAKSHPWWIDALGLVDTIEVTFTWTGTDTEWYKCLVAREKQVSEIDLSEIEVEKKGSTPN